MTTALIRACADRARAQILEGVKAIHAGEMLTAELHFSLAMQALRNLEALLDSPQPPVRGLAVVSQDETLPEWMERKANDDPKGAA